MKNSSLLQKLVMIPSLTGKIPLTIKIWFMLLLFILVFYFLMLIIFPFVIRNFLTTTLLEPPHEKFENLEGKHPPYGFPIRQFMLLEDGSTIPQQAQNILSMKQLDEILANAAQQTETRQRYELMDEKNNRYLIEKIQIYDRPVYQVSIIRKSDENMFVQNLLVKFMFFAGLALLVSWLLSLIFARYLTRPLIKMSHHVKRIADHDWEEPLDVKNNDEIGHLAQSIETMRQQLIAQEKTQQHMMQNISHELKTPVMIIRSYAQAMQDGVFPKGDLGGSIQIIDKEGARLEKLIKQLLCLTRLDYSSTQKPLLTTILLDELIKEIVDTMRITKMEIDFSLELQSVSFQGDIEKWRVLIENILDNHIRYAKSQVIIALRKIEKEQTISLYFWNNGSQTEFEVSNQDIQPFRKGSKGKYGLGLTIAQRIVGMYHGEIHLYNEKDGVCTSILLPL